VVNLFGHAVVSYREVNERSLGLSAPVMISWNLDLSQRVDFHTPTSCSRAYRQR
jgi:hypothetical protein